MTDRQKNKILAIYQIYITSGVKISESLQAAVDKIRAEK